MAEEFDLVILGGGTGGYVAAIRASQLGLKTAIVEKEQLGGTCLHKGCIPSKALLRSAQVYQTVKKSDEYGISSTEISLDFSKVQSRKNQIVSKLHQGVQYLMKKGKIKVFEGYGRMLGPSIFSPLPGTVSVELNNGEENEILIPKNVLIATGSRPKSLVGLNIDGEKVLSSDEALQLEELPKSIIIIGGGVIGIEWASMLHDFGVKVTVLEYANQILPNEDEETAAEMTKLLRNKGIEIVTGAKVSPEACDIGEMQHIRTECNGEVQEFVAEKVLVSVGREANTSGIGIENTEIEIEHGYIATNHFYQTKESHIYAVGDCIGGLQLAHVAAREGCLAVEHIAGEKPYPLDYSAVPRCIYSNPEMASIGLTEQEAKTKGYEVKIGKFPLQAIGKALVHGEVEGFAKIIANAKTNDLLGIHIIGAHATELISEAAVAKILDATAWEIGLTIHPHPSLSEVIGEAALAVDGLSLHL